MLINVLSSADEKWGVYFGLGAMVAGLGLGMSMVALCFGYTGVQFRCHLFRGFSFLGM
jgi:hypothetical protein